MTQQFDTYVPPVLEDSDEYKPHEHIGHWLIVKVMEFKPSVVTSNTPGGGPAVIVDLVDLDGAVGPVVLRKVLWMGGSFVDGLKAKAPGGAEYTGQPVVIGIESRKSASSNRPYAAPLPADPAALARAAAYYQANGDPFAQSFQTVTVAKDSPPF